MKRFDLQSERHYYLHCSVVVADEVVAGAVAAEAAPGLAGSDIDSIAVAESGAEAGGVAQLASSEVAERFHELG